MLSLNSITPVSLPGNFYSDDSVTSLFLPYSFTPQVPLLDFTLSLMPSVPMRHLGWGLAPCTRGARRSRDRWSEHNVVSVSYKHNLLWTACRCTDVFSVFFWQSSVRHQVKAECDACLPSLFSVEVRRPGASTLIWHFLKMLHWFFKSYAACGPPFLW